MQIQGELRVMKFGDGSELPEEYIDQKKEELLYGIFKKELTKLFQVKVEETHDSRGVIIRAEIYANLSSISRHTNNRYLELESEIQNYAKNLQELDIINNKMYKDLYRLSHEITSSGRAVPDWLDEHYPTKNEFES